MQLDGIANRVQSFFFAFTLTSNIDVQTLGHEPVALFPD